MRSPNYQAVLDDLRARRSALDAAIKGIELIVGHAAEPEEELEEPEPKLKRAYTKRAAVQSMERKDTRELTIQDAIVAAVREPAMRTAPELMDRVEQLRPGTNRPSIQACINQMQRDGKLHKDEELKIHLVENGRICA